MKGTVLDNVRTVKDLGITVSDYLNWRLHISNITSKANKVLGLIKRVCKDLKDPDTRKTLLYTVHWSYHSFSIALSCGHQSRSIKTAPRKRTMACN